MKTRIAMMTAIAIMAIQFTFGTEPAKRFATEEQKIAYAKKNLLVAIHSPNMGVVEASLRVTTQLKMLFPSEDISELMEVMETMWQKHPDGKMRYKAYIAKSICESPEWYTHNSTLLEMFDQDFFYVASDKMREQLLSVNSK